MNHHRKRTRYRRHKFDRSIYPIHKPMGRNWKKGRYQMGRTHHWFVDGRIYSKLLPREVEILWLMMNHPEVPTYWAKVQGYEKMPMYRDGRWDGEAFHVDFTNHEQASFFFQIQWMNSFRID